MVKELDEAVLVGREDGRQFPRSSLLGTLLIMTELGTQF